MVSFSLNKWNKFCTTHETLIAAADYVCEVSDAAIAKKGVFHFVATGGRSAAQLYEILGVMPNKWSNWHIWWGDERCVPRDHPDRNSLILRKFLPVGKEIPESQVHEIRAELGPYDAAIDYITSLRAVNRFDFVLLSLGEDGHVASLFSKYETEIINSMHSAIPVIAPLKLPPARVSLSPARLSNSDHVLCLALGASKREALMKWSRDEDVPVSMIFPEKGVDIYVDSEAWPGFI